MLWGDVTYLLWSVSIAAYKHIKYVVWESTSSMDLLQEIILLIYYIAVISWDVILLQELLSTGIHTNLFISTDPIMLGLMNIIFKTPHKTSTLPVIYSFNEILKVLFVVFICSAWFRVNFILYLIHFVVQQFSNMKLICLLLEIKLVPNLLDDEYFIIPHFI